jgi:hypothetical protein
MKEYNMTKTEIRKCQKLINSGNAWRLEGSFGRYAMNMIENGFCMLGLKGHRDYWGNYVPSRFEVKPGTKGSREYMKKAREDINEYND